MQARHPHVVFVHGAHAAEVGFALVEPRQRIRLAVEVRKIQLGVARGIAAAIVMGPVDMAAATRAVRGLLGRWAGGRVLAGLGLLRARDADVVGVQAFIDGGELGYDLVELG